MKIEKRYLDILTTHGWSENRCVDLPKEYLEFDLSNVSKKIIQNLYGLKIIALSIYTGADYRNNFFDGIIALNQQFICECREELEEVLGFCPLIHIIARRSDGETFFVDNYGRFFCFNSISYNYIGNDYNSLFKYMFDQDVEDSYFLRPINKLCYIKRIPNVRIGRRTVSVYQLDPIKGFFRNDDLEETELIESDDY